MTRKFIYAKEELLYALIATHTQYHEVLKADAHLFLAALEQGFGISFKAEGVASQHRAIWMVFHACVENYAALQSPLGGFLDSSLCISQLKREREAGQEILTRITQTGQAVERARENYFALLSDLFKLLWQPQVESVSSDRLLGFGFNDAKRPDPMEYW